jgi:hypothetical protein
MFAAMSSVGALATDTLFDKFGIAGWQVRLGNVCGCEGALLCHSFEHFSNIQMFCI